ncbi:MAG: HAMP domain-containing histidine kinase [Oscillospiraceae bacterium]|nr:HAMP domain-containing histidine kinase [Oscillospiraceae bacterium]
MFKKLRQNTITNRWLFNILGVVIVMLLITAIVAAFVVNHYYYNSAEQYVANRMSIVTSAIDRFANNAQTNYNSEIRSIVENYEYKSQIELMAIDIDGNVSVTSSGFSVEGITQLPDFEVAKNSENGIATEIYELPTGEKVLAYTAMIAPLGSEYQAVRMVVSLESIDRQVLIIVLVMILFFAAIIVLMIFTGQFFVRSIVNPVREVNAFIRQIAVGDFSDRLTKKSDDELGQLCDSINYMANELANTEAMKNEFISSVSHELRTPLTAIKGWSETLMSMSDDKETLIKGMRVITGETERLSNMVEELLDFSRLQDGRLKLNKAKMDVLAELGETVLIYQERAKKLGISLDYYEPEMLPFVYGDKNRIKQVFINIVDNAIKYSDEGDKISVEAYVEGNDIVISVSDTGIGISSEDLPKVKAKFFKANQTRRGSGIGLAVADEIIHLHGGTLTLKSELNVGTTVMITLPPMESDTKVKDKSDKVNVELITTNDDERTIVYEQPDPKADNM